VACGGQIRTWSNVWSAARLQGKSLWMKKVCVNVSGLFVEVLFSWP